MTTAEAKAVAQIDHSDEDTLIDSYIATARQLVEAYTGRQIVTATWDLWLNAFPGAGAVELPYGALQSVDHVKYYDGDGTLQTLSSSVYTVDTTREPARVYRAFGQSWPLIRDIRDAVNIRITAGYGAASAVPEAIKTAIKFAVASWLENPDGCGALPIGSRNILDHYLFSFEF